MDKILEEFHDLELDGSYELFINPEAIIKLAKDSAAWNRIKALKVDTSFLLEAKRAFPDIRPSQAVLNYAITQCEEK